MAPRVTVGPGARFAFSPEYIAAMGGPIVEQPAMAQDMNTGLVAVSDRNGGFHVYMTGGLWEPSRWLRGNLDGCGWFDSKAALADAAERHGRQLRRHADYYQLPPAPMDARATWEG